MLDDTLRALTSKQAEVFVLWTAPLPAARSSGSSGSSAGHAGRGRGSGASGGGGCCAVRRAIVPDQESHTGIRGAHVHVPGRELARIAFDNYKRGERSVAQVHTHPSASTRMSLLDVQWEVVAHPGALSIIVPDYCRGGPLSFRKASIYERQEGGRWRLWGAGELGRRIKVQCNEQRA